MQWKLAKFGLKAAKTVLELYTIPVAMSVCMNVFISEFSRARALKFADNIHILSGSILKLVIEFCHAPVANKNRIARPIFCI